LLENRQATTHWRHAADLEALGIPYVRKRVVEDGKVITAAGVTAGIDMGLRLLAQLTSVASARRTQLVIEYDPQPPYGGIDWSSLKPAPGMRESFTLEQAS
jgi:transcriptional regulator GlxA family with amidase domain